VAFPLVSCVEPAASRMKFLLIETPNVTATIPRREVARHLADAAQDESIQSALALLRVATPTGQAVGGSIFCAPEPHLERFGESGALPSQPLTPSLSNIGSDVPEARVLARVKVVSRRHAAAVPSICPQFVLGEIP
jgi:hypothetical protein